MAALPSAPALVNVLFYSAVEFTTGFSSSLTMLLVLRTLYGVGMGGASTGNRRVSASHR
jgi:hypothetical protein